ncbi:iron export ABC transporter permease subunit FetB [Lichenihabitans sp. PAMC28606]|uniref:ABC transporter permease n=1 Tax=Lichenihabitans sp. PAMC28606 TaxID=2880932 RepID=UPI001D0A2307|nr:iron export ABC transporter permease subunit FetB [Lichenihabitans sp. PAMC28606]UDL95972.1 iron export ABC transporter permease subunit FetB [Lichenihabitans sp. PAMC28606]
MTPILLTPLDLAIASLLVLASAGLSMLLTLGVHRPLLIASTRMVVQLVLVGFVLRQIFAISSGWLTALAVGVMLAAASREVGARSPRRLSGLWHYAVGTASIVIATVTVAVIALTTALRPTPWNDAHHVIPLVGIIVGNVMNAASLALNSVFSTVTRERAAIDARLALGATRAQAFETIVRQAVMAGIIPTINQMAAAGIITLPGIMTGQVLAGMDPLEAAKYQILLMFVLAGGGFLGSLIAVEIAVRRLSDKRQRLRLDRLDSKIEARVASRDARIKKKGSE